MQFWPRPRPRGSWPRHDALGLGHGLGPSTSGLVNIPDTDTLYTAYYITSDVCFRNL